MKNHLNKIILLYLASVVLACAQASVAPQITVDGSRLSGSWLKPEELANKSDVIFTGQILSLSLPDFVAASSPSYGAKVKVTQLLKGTIASEVTVILHVTKSGSVLEDKPELNHTYIFFAKVVREDNLTQVKKLMDGTSENISKITSLIAATPAGK